jgi:long-subunit acyl-CoA synthetase (AMP-forming)
MTESETTIPKLIESQISKYRGKLLLQRRDGWSWKQITWLDFDRDVKSVACFLLDLDFNYGDAALIISGNRMESFLTEIAVYHLGGVIIPIPRNEAAERIPEIAEHYDVKFIFVEDASGLTSVLDISEKISNLKRVVVFSGTDGVKDGRVIQFRSLIKFGMLKRKQLEDDLRKISGNLSSESVACVFHNSGLQGAGGIREITHHNIIESLKRASEKLFNINDEEQTFSYLPLVSPYEKIISYLAIYIGFRMVIAETREDFFENILEVKPTIIYETQSGLEGILSKHLEKNRIADPHVLRNELGGRANRIITDSLPRDEIKELIRSAGITLIELPDIYNLS